MRAIPRETRRVTYSTEIRTLKTIPFTEMQKAVIVGSILGDGCLCENWSGTNYRLFINHCVEQREYLMWKYGVLKNFILSEPRFYLRNNSLTIRTISHPELTMLRATFYSERRKIVPKNIEEFLTDPLVLAVWFMDDGNVTKSKNYLHGYHINTQSFTREENNVFVRVFRNLYGVECSIQRNNGYCRLFIGSNGRDRFSSIIRSLLLPSMSYKLG